MEAPYGSPRSFTCAIPFLAGAPAPAPLSPDIPFDCDPPPFDDGGALRAASCRRCSAAIRCACPGFVPPTMDENLGGGGAVTVAGGAAAAAAAVAGGPDGAAGFGGAACGGGLGGCGLGGGGAGGASDACGPRLCGAI